MRKYKYTIKTDSKLLVEFSQCPEGVAKMLLVVTFPFWGTSWVVRKLFNHNIPQEK